MFFQIFIWKKTNYQYYLFNLLLYIFVHVKAFKKFYFERFEFERETLTASFYYSFDKELFFEEKICFLDENFSLRSEIDMEVLENILFHMHIALGISYYKYFPTSELSVETGFLDQENVEFWKKFYLNGLWEFFYRNDFDPSGVCNFVSSNEKKFQKKDFEVSGKSLVPVWWGKDSIVSIEILKSLWKQLDLVTFAVQDNILYQNTRDISWYKRLFIKRIFWNYSHLVKEWYYNWHVPITGIIAFVLEWAAYLYDYKNIVLSNEKSANFWNIFWKWLTVNHQYSKSAEFEKDFWAYVAKNISSHVHYFSLLRPFYELKIAEMFAKYGKKYFSEFSSCNTNFKIFKDLNSLKKNSYWCNECPKCAFVYAILRPFLTHEETLSIFWKELYEDESLETLFRELLWLSGIKPFECVGTNEEVVLAMKMALQKWEGDVPYILKIFQKEVDVFLSQAAYKTLQENILLWDFSSTNIPQDLEKYLKTL